MNHYIRRLYQPLIENHFTHNRQMLFLMGPRQVGKTTLTLHLASDQKNSFYYLNWDNLDHRAIFLEGPSSIARFLNLDLIREIPPLLVLDEIHKFKDWKNLLKGFFDTYAHNGEIRIIVTGSARLDIYNVGGDSLMGRYFRYRIHPFSVGEMISSEERSAELNVPARLEDDKYDNLYHFGGFPEPLMKANPQFYENWKGLRFQQLFYEEVRDLTKIQEIRQMELLAVILRNQVGGLTNYTALANKVRVSIETIRRWIDTLSQLYYCFSVRPWSRNVTRSLVKEPKFYLWDWALIEDSGAKSENFIASHLSKACHYWTDQGLGSYDLYFLRDKEKREVDFLVSKNEEPWFLVEVKNSMAPLSSSLGYFQKETSTPHAFQVTIDAEFQKINCFDFTRPIIVSAKTFLSQLP